MQQTIHEALHVKAIQHADCAEPKKTGPAKKQVTEADGNDDERNLKLGPDGVSREHEIGAPLFHARRLTRIEPPKVSPPNPTVSWTGDIIDCVGVRMMIPMICDPSAGRTRPVVTSEKNQNLLNDRM